MSFLKEVIEEVVNSDEGDKEDLIAEFVGFSTVSGFLRISSNGTEFVLRAHKPAAIRRIIKITRHLFEFEVGPLTLSESAFEKWYEISFKSEKLHEKLKDAGIELTGFSFIYSDLLGKIQKDKKLLNSFFRGVFLAGGYICDPRKNRMIELQLSDEEVANYVFKLLKKIGLRPGIRHRKHRYYVYLKSYKDIKDFLRRIGAVQASFKFEDEQAIKEMKNMVNRQVNFEKANVERTVSTARRQIHAIKMIDKYIGIENLAQPLKEAALLRLKHPFANLNELASLSSPPISKSGLTNRLKRLEALALKIEKSKKGEK